MSVADLFESPPVTLVADADGGIRYWPRLVDAERAARWFDALRTGIAWQRERRRMYDRTVDVPRLLAGFRAGDFPRELPLAEMLACVQAVVPAPYNAAGLNLYRDGGDSVAMHNDTLHAIIAGQPIALVSLGHPRRMNLRAKSGAGKGIAIDLEPGSLLVMSHASQHTHEHGIPKTTRPVGARISVVFRVRPTEGAPDY